jgi:hypothetical protein
MESDDKNQPKRGRAQTEESATGRICDEAKSSPLAHDTAVGNSTAASDCDSEAGEVPDWCRILVDYDEWRANSGTYTLCSASDSLALQFSCSSVADESFIKDLRKLRMATKALYGASLAAKDTYIGCSFSDALALSQSEPVDMPEDNKEHEKGSRL